MPLFCISFWIGLKIITCNLIIDYNIIYCYNELKQLYYFQVHGNTLYTTALDYG